MAKSPADPSPSPQGDQLRELALELVKMAEEGHVPSQKERGMPLARLVLEINPKFGEKGGGLKKIAGRLQQENIGLPTFKKCLSLARGELLKKPKRAVAARAEPKPKRAPSPSVAKPAAAKGSVAMNTDRKLL